MPGPSSRLRRPRRSADRLECLASAREMRRSGGDGPALRAGVQQARPTRQPSGRTARTSSVARSRFDRAVMTGIPHRVRLGAAVIDAERRKLIARFCRSFVRLPLTKGPALDHPRPFLGSIEERRTTTAVDLVRASRPNAAPRRMAQIRHRGQLVLSGPGDALGMLATAGMRAPLRCRSIAGFGILGRRLTAHHSGSRFRTSRAARRVWRGRSSSET